MPPRSTFFKWVLLGAVTASVLTWAQAAETGGIAGLLQVGETSSLRPMIEEQLGDIPLAPGPGHDGQIFYAIALDLSGDKVAPLLDHGAYRYRRILFPLIASAFGALDGYPLLWGMIIVSIASVALASGAIAALSVQVSRSEWLALVVILNPGVWLSARLLTSDNLALALMAVAIAYVATSPRRSSWGFALSALAKDVYLTTPLGMGLSKDRRRWWPAAVATGALLAWMTLLTIRLGEGFTGRGNLAFPFTGIIEGAENWSNLDASEWFYLGFALVSVGAGLTAGIWRKGVLRWPLLGWSLLGLISSNWVWDIGNNAARATAPIVILIGLSFLLSERTHSHTDAIAPALLVDDSEGSP